MNEGPIDALRAMGASADTIEQARVKLGLDKPAPGTPVLPQCWYAVQVFGAMSTQWHWRGTPHGSMRAGLRLEVLPTVLASLRHEPHRLPLHELLPQLRVMEQAALEELNRST